jgi:hypothetical protein
LLILTPSKTERTPCLFEDTIMPRVSCSNCYLLFEDAETYTDHLVGDSNNGCHFALFGRNPLGAGTGVAGRRSSAESAAVSRTAPFERMLDETEAAVKAAKESSLLMEANDEFDDSVFDFHGPDSDPEFSEVPVFEWRRNPKKRNQKKTGASATKEGPRKSRLEEFKEYVDFATKNHVPLGKDLVAAIELMNLMNEKGGNDTLYEAVFEWHIEHLDCTVMTGASKLNDFLVKRYFMKDCLPKERRVTMPSNNEDVNITCHDAMAQVVDLLTDPRIAPEDYLFHDDDPFAAPPEEFTVLGDVNTGLSYRVAYDQLIRAKPFSECGRRRVLLPFIFYLDGCVTGQFMNLPIEIVKMTFGIFKRKFRNLNCGWRKLGFIHQTTKGKSEGLKMIADSDHVDSHNYVKDNDYRTLVGTELEEMTPDFDKTVHANASHDDTSVPKLKAQDLHKQLQVILSHYKCIEMDDGFAWDCPTKEGG